MTIPYRPGPELGRKLRRIHPPQPTDGASTDGAMEAEHLHSMGPLSGSADAVAVNTERLRCLHGFPGPPRFAVNMMELAWVLRIVDILVFLVVVFALLAIAPELALGVLVVGALCAGGLG